MAAQPNWFSIRTRSTLHLNSWSVKEFSDSQIVRQSVVVEDADMLRATTVLNVLSRCGGLFGGSQGNDATYALSFPVTRMRYFLSHNWSARRRDKFFALAVFFNLRSSVLCLAVYFLAATGLTARGLLPVGSYNRGSIGVCCQAVGVPLLLLLLLGSHEVSGRLRRGLAWGLGPSWGPPTMFLDKVCIHQSDGRLKKLGIEKLGAFISSADTLLILYNDLYLQKLWTIYEVACFLVTNPDGRMVVLCPTLHRILLGGLLLVYFAMSVNRLLLASVFFPEVCGDLWHGIACGDLLRTACYLISAMAFAFLSRGWTRQVAEVRTRAKAFRMAEARCFDEADRPVVQRNVASFMRDAALVDGDASEEEALAVFEGFVQQRVPKALERSIGNAGLHYLVAASISLATVFAFQLDRLGGFYLRQADDEHSLRKAGLYLAYALWTNFALVPLSMAALIRQVSWQLSLRGRLEVLFVLVIGAEVSFLAMVLDYLVFFGLLELAGESDIILVPFVVVVAASFVLTWIVYRGRRLPGQLLPDPTDDSLTKATKTSMLRSLTNSTRKTEEPRKECRPTLMTAPTLHFNLGTEATPTPSSNSSRRTPSWLLGSPLGRMAETRSDGSAATLGKMGRTRSDGSAGTAKMGRTRSDGSAATVGGEVSLSIGLANSIRTNTTRISPSHLDKYGIDHKANGVLKVAPEVDLEMGIGDVISWASV